MSKPTGHWWITERAVRELSLTCSGHSLGSRLPQGLLQADTVSRDILDVFSGNHWLAKGQRHHFMRRKSGQTSYEAYLECTEWIQKTALASAELLSRRIRRYYNPSSVPRRTPVAIGPAESACELPQILSPLKYPGAAATRVLRGESAREAATAGIRRDRELPDMRTGVAQDAISWRELGNAIHALQDSFAEGHVVRGAPRKGIAGPIRAIKKYAGTDKIGHGDFDKMWRDKAAERATDPGDPSQAADLVERKNGKAWRDKVKFTPAGRHAIDATKALVQLVAKAGIQLAAGGSSDFSTDWKKFQESWLAADEKQLRHED